MLNRRGNASISIDQALTDPMLLGAALGDRTSWSHWISILRAAFALPMTNKDCAAFREVAGDRVPPNKRVDELWCVIGRRSGKTRMAAAHLHRCDRTAQACIRRSRLCPVARRITGPSIGRVPVRDRLPAVLTDPAPANSQHHRQRSPSKRQYCHRCPCGLLPHHSRQNPARSCR